MKPEELRKFLQFLRDCIPYLDHDLWNLSEEEKKPYRDALIFCGENGLAGKVIHYEAGREEKFLKELAQMIDNFLGEAEISKFSAAIPKNLKEIVDDYSKHLERDYQRQLEKVERKQLGLFQEQTRENVLRYRGLYEDLKKTFAEEKILTQTPQLLEMSSHEAAGKIIEEVPPLGAGGVFQPEESKKLVIPTVGDVLQRIGIEKPKIKEEESLVKKLLGTTQDIVQAIARAPRQPREKEIKEELPLPPIVEKRLEAEEGIKRSLRIAMPAIGLSLKESEEASEDIGTRLTAYIEGRYGRRGELDPRQIKELVKRVLEKSELKSGRPFDPKKIPYLVRRTLEDVARYGETLREPPYGLPPNLAAWLKANPHSAGDAWPNTFVGLPRHLWASLFLKPLGQLTKASVKSRPDHPFYREHRLMSEKGVFAEDAGAMIKTLLKPEPDHPQIEGWEKLKKSLSQSQGVASIASIKTTIKSLREADKPDKLQIRAWEKLALLSQGSVSAAKVTATLKLLQRAGVKPDHPQIKAWKEVGENLSFTPRAVSAASVAAAIKSLQPGLEPDDPKIEAWTDLEENLFLAQKEVTFEDIEVTLEYFKREFGESDPRVEKLIRLKEKARFLPEPARVREGKLLPLDENGQLIPEKIPNQRGFDLLEKAARIAKETGSYRPPYIDGLGYLHTTAHSPQTAGGLTERVYLAWRRFQLDTRLGQRLWEEVEMAPGYTEIRFIPIRRIASFVSGGRYESFRGIFNSLYQNSFGKLINSFAQTKLGEKIIALGARLSEFGTKAAAWVAGKLGLDVGISIGLDAVLASLGLAGAVPTGGLSLVITAAIELVKKIIKKITHSIGMFLHDLFDKPEKSLAAIALGAAIFGAGALGLIAAPVALVGGLGAIAIGGIGLINIGIASAGTIALGAAVKTTAFITHFFIGAAKDGISLLVVAVLGISAALTFFFVITTAGAFIIPTAPVGPGAAGPVFGTAINPRNPEEIENLNLAEELIFILYQCGITYVNEGTLGATVSCIENSTLPNEYKNEIIEQIRYSIEEVGPGLQCVGFVRAITAALGRDIGPDRNARDYLNPPTPAGYDPVNTNMGEVEAGDIVIMGGTTYGHMGIVVDTERDEENNLISITVAQSWGTHNGWIQVTEVNPALFDGFLRPV